MRIKLNEEITSPLAKTPEDLAKKVINWYDWEYRYIDDGRQQRAAITKNEYVVDWFGKHPIEIKDKAYKILKSKLHPTVHGDLKREFETQLKESMNEGIVTIALGVAGGLLLLKILAKVLKFVVGKIGLNVPLPKDKLIEIKEKVIDAALKSAISNGRGDLSIPIVKLGKYIDDEINSGKITKAIHIVNLFKKLKDGELKIKESVNEPKKLSEVTVTRIPNFNLESDAYIIMLQLLKNNAKFKKVVSSHAEDLYSGARPSTTFTSLQSELSKVVTPEIILSVVEKMNEKRKILFVSNDEARESRIITKFSGVLSMGIIDSLIGDPIDLALLKQLGNAKVAQLAKEYSINRGKSKFTAMVQNKGF